MALRDAERSIARLIDPDDPAAEPEGEALARARRMRTDGASRRAALLISGLMRTPDCALDLFRDGRGADPALDVRYLQRTREILDALHDAITSKDAERWTGVEAAWRSLGLEASSAAQQSPVVSAPAPATAAVPASAPAIPAVPASAPAIPAVPASAPASASPWASRPEPARPGPSPSARAERDPALLDRTARAAMRDEDRTSLHVLSPDAEPVLPFRAAPATSAIAPTAASGGGDDARADVAMEADDGLEEATQRIRMHVLPFKSKPVPFAIKAATATPPDEPDPASHAQTVPLGQSSPLLASAARPSAEPVASHAVSPPAGASLLEDRTERLRLDPPTQEPPTTRSEASVLASTVEMATRRVPLPIRPASPAAAPRPSAHDPSTAAARPTGAAAPTAARHPGRANELPVTASLLELEGYAAYRAELSLYPDRIAEIRQRYPLPEAASYERLDAHWRDRLARDPALRQRWEAFCQRYAALMLQKLR